MKKWLTAVAVSLGGMVLFNACGKTGVAKQGTTPVGGSDTVTTILNADSTAVMGNIPYGTDSKQVMDVSLVAGRNAATPFVVLIHGGGWSTGDKSDIQSSSDFFISQGINVANINYRLTTAGANSVRWRDLISDVNKAMTYLSIHADAWKLRKNGYVTFGYSAGAHLSLLYGYAYDSLSMVSAVIGFGSPTKFNDLGWSVQPYLATAESALPPLDGQPFTTDTSNSTLKLLSPYFCSAYKPTLLIHGQLDQLVPPSQSSLMVARLKAAGVPQSLIILKNGGHSGEGVSQQDFYNAFMSATAWIKTYSQ